LFENYENSLQNMIGKQILVL